MTLISNRLHSLKKAKGTTRGLIPETTCMKQKISTFHIYKNKRSCIRQPYSLLFNIGFHIGEVCCDARARGARYTAPYNQRKKKVKKQSSFYTGIDIKTQSYDQFIKKLVQSI